MVMSDTTGSNSVSCCNMPDSSSQDDYYHHQHLQPEPAAERPECSQQPIDGIETRVEVILNSQNTKHKPRGFVVIATTAYRALETETSVRQPHRVSPSGIRAGLAGGLLVAVASMLTLVTER